MKVGTAFPALALVALTVALPALAHVPDAGVHAATEPVDPGQDEDPFAPPPTSRATAAVTASAPDTAYAGSAVEVSANVTGARATGEIAILQERTEAGWTAVASAKVGSGGGAELTVSGADLGSHDYSVHLPATTRHTAADSDTVVVDVVPASSDTAASASTTSQEQTPTTSNAGCGDVAPLRPDGRPWICTFDDEFSAPGLDRRYWVPQLSASSGYLSGTTAAPACFVDEPGTISQAEDNLVLSAQVLDQPVTCGKTSTRLVSGMVTQNGTFAQTYGRYEVRAKLPAWTGKGLQETFWLWPTDLLRYGTAWPASGEIDFAEFYSNYGWLVLPIAHYLFDPATISYATSTNIFKATTCRIKVGDYNTYGLDWEPGTLTTYVNGVVCFTDNYVATNAPDGHPSAPFDGPFFLSLTQAFGVAGNDFDPATAPATSTTLVDYVRVWQ